MTYSIGDVINYRYLFCVFCAQAKVSGAVPPGESQGQEKAEEAPEISEKVSQQCWRQHLQEAKENLHHQSSRSYDDTDDSSILYSEHQSWGAAAVNHAEPTDGDADNAGRRAGRC